MPLALSGIFGPEEGPLWKRMGLLALGVAWMGFMVRTALANRGRQVVCDGSNLRVRDPFSSRRFAVGEVRQVVREDLRKKFREVEELGMSRRDKFQRMDTLAPMVVYTLQDAQGRELLRLDQQMEPQADLQRLVQWLAQGTGAPIQEV